MGLAYVIGAAILWFLITKLNGNYIQIYVSTTHVKDYHAILIQHNDYYRHLSPAGRKKFIKRLHRFRIKKNFIGQHGLEIEDKHVTLISAAAIQITFGLENYVLNNFYEIMVFPETFRFTNSDVHYKGLTGQSGKILLSWKDFLEGYETKDDKLNLGIHEMAHALELNALLGSDTTMDFAVKYDTWKEKSTDEYHRIRNDEDSFLRNYAGKSEREFFAVCLEHFFEAPKEFSDELPDIYIPLCNLLNQDPRNAHSDYLLEKSI
jgi:Mlc titration factor MtfA (ptsG expression regulator)